MCQNKDEGGSQKERPVGFDHQAQKHKDQLGKKEAGQEPEQRGKEGVAQPHEDLAQSGNHPGEGTFIQDGGQGERNDRKEKVGQQDGFEFFAELRPETRFGAEGFHASGEAEEKRHGKDEGDGVNARRCLAKVGQVDEVNAQKAQGVHPGNARAGCCGSLHGSNCSLRSRLLGGELRA